MTAVLDRPLTTEGLPAFDPDVATPESHGTVSLMDETGDTRTMWDRTKPEEVAAARQQFAKLKGDGYLAYSVKGKKGKAGVVLHEFDPDAERIIYTKPMAGG